MLHRFAAGSVVASVAIAIGAAAMLLVSAAAMIRFYPVVHLWCLMPVVWGVWTMVTPRTWMPHRLPMWGAILGFFVALNGVFVLDVPGRVMGTTATPMLGRVIGLIFAIAAYYLLWMLVRKVYLSLTTTIRPETKERGKSATA